MKKILYILNIAFSSILLFNSCEKPDRPVYSEDPKVISFEFRKADNPCLVKNVEGIIDEKEKKITAVINYQPTEEVLYPTIKISSGASSDINTGDPVKITSPQSITVSREGHEVTYDIIFRINEDPEILYVKINGVAAYYCEKEKTYYAPLDKKEWGNNVTVEVIASGSDDIWVGGSAICAGIPEKMPLETGKAYTVAAKGGKYDVTATLIISGLPIITVDSKTEHGNLERERVPCEVSLIDPYNGGERSLYDLYGGIKIRGNSASYYNKRSLSLELRDKNTEETVDKRFLGMREDDDWILDAMFSEQLRAKNRVSHDLWFDMHKLHYLSKEPKARPTNRGEYAELFYNGEYYGIYCISEYVDRKQLDLKTEGGYLYKAESWDYETFFSQHSSSSFSGLGDKYYNGWEIKYPKPNYDWMPLADFMKFAIRSDYSGGKNSTFGKGISDRINIDNVVDYLLFLNIVCGTDNTGRNTFLAIYDKNGSAPEDRKFFYIPWDLDATFGTDWLFEDVNPNGFFLGFEDVGPSSNTIPSECAYGNRMIAKIAKYDIDGFGSKIKARWKELRGGPASDNALIERFEKYYKLLKECGAYARDIEKWEEHYQSHEWLGGKRMDPDAAMAHVRTWIPQHMAYLDNYINNWDDNIRKMTVPY